MNILLTKTYCFICMSVESTSVYSESGMVQSNVKQEQIVLYNK